MLFTIADWNTRSTSGSAMMMPNSSAMNTRMINVPYRRCQCRPTELEISQRSKLKMNRPQISVGTITHPDDVPTASLIANHIENAAISAVPTHDAAERGVAGALLRYASDQRLVDAGDLRSHRPTCGAR